MDITAIVYDVCYHEYLLFQQMKDIKSIEAVKNKFVDNRFDVFLSCVIVRDEKLFQHYKSKINWMDIEDLACWPKLITWCYNIDIIRFIVKEYSLDKTICLEFMLLFSNDIDIVKTMVDEMEFSYENILLCINGNEDDKFKEYMLKYIQEKIKIELKNNEFVCIGDLRDCQSIISLETIQKVHKLTNMQCLEFCVKMGNLFGAKYYFGLVEGKYEMLDLLNMVVVEEPINCMDKYSIIEWILYEMSKTNLTDNEKTQAAFIIFSKHVVVKRFEKMDLLLPFVDKDTIKTENLVNFFEKNDENIINLLHDNSIYELKLVAENTKQIFDIDFFLKYIKSMDRRAFEYFILRSTFNLSDIKSIDISWHSDIFKAKMVDYELFFQDSIKWLRTNIKKKHFNKIYNFILDNKLVGNILNEELIELIPYKMLVKLYEKNVWSFIVVEDYNYELEIYPDVSKNDVIITINNTKYYGDQYYFNSIREFKVDEIKCDVSLKVANIYVLLALTICVDILKLSIKELLELVNILNLYPIKNFTPENIEHELCQKIASVSENELDEIVKVCDLFELKYARMCIAKKIFFGQKIDF